MMQWCSIANSANGTNGTNGTNGANDAMVQYCNDAMLHMVRMLQI